MHDSDSHDSANQIREIYFPHFTTKLLFARNLASMLVPQKFGVPIPAATVALLSKELNPELLDSWQM